MQPVTEEEAQEFLKFIKHSEYSVVEQLSKTPAKISVLSLLLNSESHRKALVEVLKKSYVPSEVSVEQIQHLVENINATSSLTFTEEEIPADGR